MEENAGPSRPRNANPPRPRYVSRSPDPTPPGGAAAGERQGSSQGSRPAPNPRTRPKQRTTHSFPSRPRVSPPTPTRAGRGTPQPGPPIPKSDPPRPGTPIQGQAVGSAQSKKKKRIGPVRYGARTGWKPQPQPEKVQDPPTTDRKRRTSTPTTTKPPRPEAEGWESNTILPPPIAIGTPQAMDTAPGHHSLSEKEEITAHGRRRNGRRWRRCQVQ